MVMPDTIRVWTREEVLALPDDGNRRIFARCGERIERGEGVAAAAVEHDLGRVGRGPRI